MNKRAVALALYPVGKPICQMTFKVSADGKTMTETGKPVGADEPFTAVYDRQK